MTALADCVLVVDDEYLIAESLRMQVEDMGMAVCGIAATAKGAVALAIKHRPQLVPMDMRLAGEGDGVDAALAIHEKVGSKVRTEEHKSELQSLMRQTYAVFCLQINNEKY